MRRLIFTMCTLHAHTAYISHRSVGIHALSCVEKAENVLPVNSGCRSFHIINVRSLLLKSITE